MNLDADRCYTALKSRDARFDGRFFTGVVTTGVYCRPICPAVTPKAKNVRFYPSAAAAEDAGFRPCLRCRPESSPGTPEWEGSSSVVSRGLRLIAEGVLDENGVDALATRLHVGSRHLRRLFTVELGASPLAVAKNRRVAFARKLIEETPLPMTQVAFSSGFASIRRFNGAFRKAYGHSPSQLRRERGRATAEPPDNGHGLQLKLFYRPPYNWNAMMAFLADRAIPGMESVNRRIYRRTVRAGHENGTVEFRPDPAKHTLMLTLSSGLSHRLIRTVEQARRQFDLKADPLAISAHLAKDRGLRTLLRKFPGVRVPGAWDGFEMGVRAIVGQQISVKGARTLLGRIVEKFGERLESASSNDIDTLFPEPEVLAESDLTQVGIVRSRSAAIRSLAKAACEGSVPLETASQYEEAIDLLTALPGIGSWTAEYIAMRALGEPDAFPAGDLGLRKALMSMEGSILSEGQIRKRAEMWRPWRAYAAMLLWTSCC